MKSQKPVIFIIQSAGKKASEERNDKIGGVAIHHQDTENIIK
jgi:hypothetical protein